MHVETPPPRRVEVGSSFNQGWGVALFVILLAIAANVAATTIHFSGYRSAPEGGAGRFGEQGRADNATHGY